MKRHSDYQRPFIDLLDRVAIFARDDALAYTRIRSRLDVVREWYGDRADWPVVCTRELARLVKTPAVAGAGHGFSWVQQPLDYELFTWILWYSEASGAEAFLLTQLVAEIEARANELMEPGHLDWDNYTQRLSLNRALKGLETFGALRRVDGSTEKWAQDRSEDSLYEFTPLARHLYFERGALRQVQGPQVESDSAALLVNGDSGSTAHGSDSPQRSPALQRLYRTLLLSPALYAAVDSQAFEALGRRDQRNRIGSDLRETLGWDLEVTETYACLLRPSATETSLQFLFPARGAKNQVLLLLFGKIQAMIAEGELTCDAYDRVRLTRSRLTTALSSLRERHGDGWGKSVGRLSAGALTDEVTRLLREWELVEGPDDDGQLYIMPLAARFRGMYEEA